MYVVVIEMRYSKVIDTQAKKNGVLYDPIYSEIAMTVYNLLLIIDCKGDHVLNKLLALNHTFRV